MMQTHMNDNTRESSKIMKRQQTTRKQHVVIHYCLQRSERLEYNSNPVTNVVHIISPTHLTQDTNAANLQPRDTLPYPHNRFHLGSTDN